jgi:lauroyl/myristoyl acyltransferase
MVGVRVHRPIVKRIVSLSQSLNLGSRRFLELVANNAPRQAAYGLASRLAPVLLRRKGERLYRDTQSVFPDRSPDWIADVVRRQQIHRAWVALDKIVLARLSDDDVFGLVDSDDIAAARSTVDRAREAGKGCVVVTLHYGRPLLGPRLFPLLGYPCTVIHAGMTRSLFQGSGKSAGGDVEFVEAGDAACALRAVRALARNRLVFVLPDGGIALRRCNVRFLDRELSIPDAIPRLVQLTGASTVAGVILSEQALRFRVRLETVASDSRDLSLTEVAESMLAPFEAAVLDDPGQWYGINRMFRRAAPSRSRAGADTAAVRAGSWAS